MPVDRECKTCGTAFRTKPSDPGLYCSRKCMYARNDTTRNCECCGKPFRSPPSQQHVRTCSLGCGYKIRLVANARGVTRIETTEDGRQVRRRVPHEKSAHNAKRRAARIRATVAWADPVKVAWFYAEAQRLTKLTGMVYHVDHIVPLTSELVCGLHNEFNLQLLPGADNIRKHNRRWPNMP